MSRTLIPALLMLVAPMFAADAAVNANSDLAIDPAKAGPDFALQGEYEAAPEDKLGVQVIALGGGNFRACIETGGLPGAGWDGQNKTEIEGKAEGGRVAISGKGWSVSIGDGALSAVEESSKRTVKMKRVLRQSPTMGAKPPAGALVLFDGSNADAWQGSMDERKLLKAGATTKQKFGSFTIHFEFMLPFKPYGRGQDRGNSGVYFQDRYEVQVLDSFGLKGVNNECGGIYTKHKPAVNMCFPPLVWQTYDVDFTAAKFDEAGQKIKNAMLTVKHNGVLIHDQAEIDSTTTASGLNTVTPSGGPIQLQDHGNPIYYRNIWAVR